MGKILSFSCKKRRTTMSNWCNNRLVIISQYVFVDELQQWGNGHCCYLLPSCDSTKHWLYPDHIWGHGRASIIVSLGWGAINPDSAHAMFDFCTMKIS